MKHMNTHKIFIALLLVLLVSGLAWAGQVIITWSWEPTEDGITAFRYQLNGEAEDAWTVVDASVTTYETDPLDDAVSHTLYVQQSFDGELWSESGMMEFDPAVYAASIKPVDQVVPAEEAPAVEEEVVAALPADETVAAEPAPAETEEIAAIPPSEPIAVASDEAATAAVTEPVEAASVGDAAVVPVETQPTETQPTTATQAPETLPQDMPAVPQVPEQDKKTMALEVSVGGGGIASNLSFVDSIIDFDPSNAYANLRTLIVPAVSVEFAMPSLFSDTLGLRLGAGYQLYDYTVTNISIFDVHVLGTLNLKLGSSVEFGIGAGAAVVVPYADLTAASPYTFNASNINWFFGPAGRIDMRINLGDAWYLSGQIEGRVLFDKNFTPYELTGLARIGLGLRF